MKSALTIAGSDPSGGAGLQADLKVFRIFDVHGLSVVTVLTAQNTEDVTSVVPVERDFLEKQLHTLLSDIRPDAVKTGMLYSRWAVELVAEVFKEYSLSNLVIDPVTVSSSGTSLLENGTLDLLREKLFPLARVITPNIYEASVLTGVIIENNEDMERASQVLKAMGPEVVVITGGHFQDVARDLFYDGNYHIVKGSRIEGEYHGTGCAFSAAITALLALGNNHLESVKKAKEFINRAIRNAYHLG
ncbi:MAG: bifunctional hydroxymethylpyrimidine kinase/phosphomethylpyrimidine kinase, partial [Nitrospira sp.]|nr:bifunctional hydroxymethylpyrimidine kinase/phosphomethylpyrimidine kinase [Nitrospira sp.]